MIAASAGECGGVVKVLACDQAIGMWLEAVGVSIPEFDGGEALQDDFGGVVGRDTMLDGYADDSTLPWQRFGWRMAVIGLGSRSWRPAC